VLGKILYTAIRITGSLGPPQQMGIGIRRQDLQIYLRKAYTQTKCSEQDQGVGLLAGGTAGTPYPQTSPVSGKRLLCKSRQHLLLQHRKHPLVAIETGDGHTTEAVQLLPLRPDFPQVLLIGLYVGQPQFPDASLDALADMVAHLAESRPAHMHLWQGPLEKLHAIGVFHPMVQRSSLLSSSSGRISSTSSFQKTE